MSVVGGTTYPSGVGRRRVTIAIVATLVTLQPLRAQGGRVEAGRRYAIAWCSGCHRLESRVLSTFAGDFTEIANLPSTTALSLRVFLHSSHNRMPNFILQPKEADDIIAYILSLKRR
jgi:mono/diheme cytochrome c family protein